jgi:hypothetical protein
MAGKNSLYICKNKEKNCTFLTCDTSKSECTKKLCNKETGVCSLNSIDCVYNEECKNNKDKYAWHDERHNKDRIKCDPTNKSCKIQNDNWNIHTHADCSYNDRCAKDNEIIREYLIEDNCKIYKCFLGDSEKKPTCQYKNCNKDCDHCGKFVDCDKFTDGCPNVDNLSEAERKAQTEKLTKNVIDENKEKNTKWLYIIIGIVVFLIIIGIVVFFVKRSSSHQQNMYYPYPPQIQQQQQARYNQQRR